MAQVTSQGWNLWVGPAPLFQALPTEVQDLMLEAASNPETPAMRFVSLRQAVVHESDACPRIPPIPGCPCYRDRPSYITFWPLQRHFLMGSAEWSVLCRTTNPRPPRDVIAATNHQGREGAVHPQVTWDPLLEQLTSVAMNNGKLASDELRQRPVEHLPTDGPRTHMAAGGPTGDTETSSTARCPAPGTPPAAGLVDGGSVWHPCVPQRHIREPAHLPRPLTYFSDHHRPEWLQNTRLLTDVFPALRELYLVDFDGFDAGDAGDTALLDKMHGYLDAPYDGSPCGRCDLRHPGRPRTWRRARGGGLATHRYLAGHTWPSADANGHGLARRMPRFKLGRADPAAAVK
ncbi:hypothetical protein LX36DRAFT_715401 [Colletotrichum falcatum]|nr:hypothetical protein LX36DRAFT_715401 [Colletotrichum falcatum]